MDKEYLKALRVELDVFLEEFGRCFARAKTAKHLGVYVRGQLGPLPRKSVEPIALEANVPPRTLQEFFSIHNWSDEGMRRRLRELVARDHGYENAVGLVDECSFAKQGSKTVGVQRQYCGSTGQVDNCVVSVHLGYAARDFHTLVDSDLYVPESWFADRERCRKAGIPEDVTFRTNWQIALQMIDRSRRDRVPFKWIVADEGYGRTPAFLQGLTDRGLLFMVEVPRSTSGWTPKGRAAGKKLRPVHNLWGRGGPTWTTYRVKDTDRGPLVWNARSTRFYPSWDPNQDLWFVVAQNVLTDEIKYFLSNAPPATDVALLLTVAFSRWRVERLFEDSKQEIGLGHFELRKYSAVQRHFAVSMVSLFFLNRLLSRGARKAIANVATAPKSARSAARSGRLTATTRSKTGTRDSTAGVRDPITNPSENIACEADTPSTTRTPYRPAHCKAMPAVDLALDVAL